MFRIFYADSDATMYEASSLINSNTGLDEILEVGKKIDTDGETLVKSRFVVKFDMSEITDVLTKYSADLNSCKFMWLSLLVSYVLNATLISSSDKSLGSDCINSLNSLKSIKPSLLVST